MPSEPPQSDDLFQQALENSGDGAGLGAFPPELPKLFDQLDRFVTIMRVYPSGHPLVYHFAEQVIERMRAFLANHRLLVQIKPHELLTAQGVSFFTAKDSDREHFLWYALAADGMVEVEFLKGVTAEEVIAFLEVINAADLGDLPRDDDTITMLWERDLKFIEYSVMEGDVGGKEIEHFGEMAEPEARTLVMGALVAPSSEQGARLNKLMAHAPGAQTDVVTRMYLGDSQRAQLSRIPDQVFADAFRVDMSWEHDLVNEWLSGNRLEYRIVEVLLSILRSDPDSAQADRALSTILEIITQLLQAHQYDLALSILEMLQARSGVFDGVDLDPLGGVLDFISDPARLEVYIFQAQKRPQDHGHIERLLRMIGPEKVQLHILQMLTRRDTSAIHDAGALIELLLGITHRDIEHHLIHDDFLSHDQYLEIMLDHLTLDHLSEIAILPRFMHKALESEHVKVRRKALQMADPCWCTSLVIERSIKPLMSSQDEGVRKLAIRTLRQLAPAEFDRWLHTVTDMEKLAFRSGGEIRFLLKLYIEQDPSRLEGLRGMLNTRGWFQGSRRVLARSVARLLLEEGDVSGARIIQDLAASLWTAPALKKKYAQMLELYWRPAADDDEASDAPPRADSPRQGDQASEVDP